MMPKALFFNVPAHGHVNPSLPLAAELTRRRHAITYFITSGYRAKVEATGATFQSYATVQDDYFDLRGLSGSVPGKVAYELITTTGEILPELLDSARKMQPDYILYDGMCPWGYMVARILRLPAVASLALLPLYTPPPRDMLNWKMLRVFAPMFLRDFDKGLEANRRARALGKQYGIPALGLATMLNSPADLAISYTSSYFQPYADSVSDTVRFVGRTIDETLPAEPFRLEQAQGRPLIYVSLGTLNNDDVGFFRTCIEALTGSNYFVVMTTGNRISPESFGALPENIAIYGWVPQVEVLKQAALFISHAGLNSIHDGLYFGVPLLLVPQQGEQIRNAMRVVELGAGLMLEKGQVNTESIRASAVRLLTDAHFKVEARRTGDTFRAAGGMARAADEIEALLRQRTSSLS
jgi:MGT family glycosyltransferase